MLYIEKYESKYLYKSLFGVLINIILNYVLINMYGIVGAATATLVTLMCISYVFDIFDSNLRKLYYLKIICWIPFYNKK